MGTVSVSGQLAELLLSLVLGIAAGAVYDLFCALRMALLHESSDDIAKRRDRRKRPTLPSVLAYAFFDIAYSVTLLLAYCSFSLLFGGGRLRVFTLVVGCLGASLWRMTASRRVLVALNFSARVLSLTAGFLMKPLCLASEGLDRLFCFITEFFKKIFKSPKKHLERNKHVSV